MKIVIPSGNCTEDTSSFIDNKTKNLVKLTVNVLVDQVYYIKIIKNLKRNNY
jgi:hypothetical protein